MPAPLTRSLVAFLATSRFHLRQLPIRLLPHRERNVLVLHHVFHAILHGHEDEQQEVDQQDGPEDWEIKHLKQGHEERRQHGPRRCDPKLELRQLACERPELLSVAGRQRCILSLWIYGGRQEPNQEVQQVNPQTVGDHEKSLPHIDPQDVERQRTGEARPPDLQPWNGLLDVMLSQSLHLDQVCHPRGLHRSSVNLHLVDEKTSQEGRHWQCSANVALSA
mmetsp:Transcript_912/g.2594  ORF Transcript_912/g.2594 Transcript_912/m.2594 type:complete len:221 (-) Transcript_912:9-671(-)